MARTALDKIQAGSRSGGRATTVEAEFKARPAA
jgi:hypothetical protein